MPSLSYLGLRKPPDKAQPVNYRPLAAVTGKHMLVIGDKFELVCFNLVTNVWSHMNCKDSFSKINERFNGTARISTPHQIKWWTKNQCSGSKTGGSLSCHMKYRRGAHLLICNRTLYVTGGSDDNSNNEKLLISYYHLPQKLDWAVERLLWLACFKNDAKRDNCFLSKCPPMIVYKIISYINSDIFTM